jgi:ribosome biogenesis GTPase
MPTEKLAALGWDHFYQQQITEEDASSVLPVRVMNVQRSGVHVAGEDIDQHIGITGSGHDLGLAVGDWLLLASDGGRIIRRLERKSLFKRRAPGTDRREQLIAANVDTLFIVSSCNQDFNEARLERYLAIAREAQVMAVIVLTKADLAIEPQEFIGRATKLASALQVEAVNALHRQELACLEAWLTPGQTIALLGSSGVGKSTLTNTLLGGNRVTTQSIREDDAKGRHTTTARSLHQLPSGAWLLDTPGMRELQLADVRAGLDDVFAEISALAGDCRFTDCNHEAEPGCAVVRAIVAGEVDPARLSRWRKLMREEALNTATIAERRARDKSFGRLYKSVIKEKQARKDG